VQPYPRKQKIFARRLRRTQTDVESRLWSRLRDRQICGAKFRRQHPLGPFIVDFCCVERRLAIELDGGQHSAQTEEDGKRTLFLRRLGFRVLRLWDNEVLMNFEAVLEQIFQALSDPRLSLSQRVRVRNDRAVHDR
jgi:very-short-patch-repair endonuclease